MYVCLSVCIYVCMYVCMCLLLQMIVSGTSCNDLPTAISIFERSPCASGACTYHACARHVPQAILRHGYKFNTSIYVLQSITNGASHLNTQIVKFLRNSLISKSA